MNNKNKSILVIGSKFETLKIVLMSDGYSVFSANNGKKAIEVLEEEKIDLLITNIRLEDMNGLELLKFVKKTYPLIFRVVIGKHQEEKDVISALRNNLAKMYLSKSWDSERINSIINKIFSIEDILKNKELLKIINNIGGLPTLPDIYSRLCFEIEKGTSIGEIAKIIEEDQSIAATVLKIVNSGFYGIRTGSIQYAISYLGLNNIKNIILTNGVLNNVNADKCSYFNPELLWKHSYFSNKLVILIYKKLLNKNIDNLNLTAGLLHDIGKIVLIKRISEEYPKVNELIKDNKRISFEDREILGISHQQIGGYLLKWWDIPYPIVEAAVFHHSPLDNRVINKELVSVVHLADYHSCKQLGISLPKEIDMNVFNYLDIKYEDYAQLLKKYKFQH
jgi:HD-like signal output (HDOD) protein